MIATNWNEYLTKKIESKCILFYFQVCSAKSYHTSFLAQLASWLQLLASCYQTPEMTNFQTSSAKLNPSEGMSLYWNTWIIIKTYKDYELLHSSSMELKQSNIWTDMWYNKILVLKTATLFTVLKTGVFMCLFILRLVWNSHEKSQLKISNEL